MLLLSPHHGIFPRRLLVLIIAFTLATSTILNRHAQAQGTDIDADAILQTIFSDITGSQFDKALFHVEDLLKRYPNFRLAHLIKGDLLLSRARPLTSFGNVPESNTQQVEALREEAIARLRAFKERPQNDTVPYNLLQMSPDQKHAILIDTKRARLYVYRNENGYPHFVRDFYVSHGKAGADKKYEGDNRTPIGVYHVTSFIPPNRLPDFYGKGAFPINYPNDWDKRLGRTGHGIWLHGTPSDTYTRPPKASEGCVVLANQDLVSLSDYIDPGLTPVVISDNMKWLARDEWQTQRKSLTLAIEAWRKDWESLNTENYLTHYSTRFRSGNTDYMKWAEQKRRISKNRQWIKVDIDNLSIFHNPGDENLITVTFKQQYHSDNHSDVMRKRQYWQWENQQWKIVFEGSV